MKKDKKGKLDIYYHFNQAISLALYLTGVFFIFAYFDMEWTSKIYSGEVNYHAIIWPLVGGAVFGRFAEEDEEHNKRKSKKK
jgi:hypothetical protein